MSVVYSGFLIGVIFIMDSSSPTFSFNYFRLSPSQLIDVAFMSFYFISNCADLIYTWSLFSLVFNAVLDVHCNLGLAVEIRFYCLLG